MHSCIAVAGLEEGTSRKVDGEVGDLGGEKVRRLLFGAAIWRCVRHFYSVPWLCGVVGRGAC